MDSEDRAFCELRRPAPAGDTDFSPQAAGNADTRISFGAHQEFPALEAGDGLLSGLSAAA